MISYLRYSMPPVPTLLTVKLRPSLAFVGISFLGSLTDFCDLCRRISVLFLTRFSELLRFLLPSRRGESFRIDLVFSSRVAGATYAEGGFLAEELDLDVFWEVRLRDEPVICLVTTGSTVMKDSSLTRDEVRRISRASADRIGRVCCRSQQVFGALLGDTEMVADCRKPLITVYYWAMSTRA